jgi:hypothetical protein
MLPPVEGPGVAMPPAGRGGVAPPIGAAGRGGVIDPAEGIG